MSMDKDLDRNLAKIRQGAIAQMTLSDIGERIVKKEVQLINSAIGLYRGNQLTGEAAQMTIAAIAEMRSLLSTLGQEAQEGVTARKEEIGDFVPN